MKRLALAVITTGLAMLVLAGCTGTGGGTPLEITEGAITQDGVTVTIEKASASPVEDPGGWDYSFDITIENASDEAVMQVVYGIGTYDADGEEIRSFGHVHDDEVRAIAPGGKASDHIDTRWGKAEPASVGLTGVTVVPESELPAIHLPQRGEYLYQALGDEKLANIKSEPPTSLSFHIDQGGAGRTATFKPGEALDTAIDLLCDIKVGNGDAEFATDNYNWIYLTWDDGSASIIRLNLRNLEFSGHRNRYHSYELENLDGFWNYAAGRAVPDGDAVQDS